MAAILQNFNELWRRTSLVQRVCILSILLACLGAGAVVVAWVSQPEYALLYADLSPEAASLVVEKARDDGIAFKLKNGGTSVYVASEHVHTMRLKMANQGLPQSGHEGYRILDKESFGASPFLQQANRIRAIEGELAKSIETLDSVTSARVHIVPAESKLFSGNVNNASATVVVRIRSGLALLAQNVGAIQAMVAGGVKGLNAGKVTVVDQNGNKLSEDGETALARGARGVLDHKIQAEQYLARKVEQLLAAALGPGRSKVQVSATVDTQSLEQTTKTVTEPVALSETTETKTPIGIKAASGIKESTTAIKYSDPGYTSSKTTKLPGTISNIMVSCLVDLSKPVKEGEDAEAAGELMSVEDVKSMIVKALGTVETNVEVIKTTFYKDPVLAAAEVAVGEESLFNKAMILDLAKRASLGVLVLGVLLALKIVRKAPKVAAQPQAAVEGQMPRSDNLLTAAAAAGSDPGALKEQISRALQDNPEEVKRLFLSWAGGEENA